MSIEPEFEHTAPMGGVEEAVDLAQSLDKLIDDLAHLLLMPPGATQFLARLDHYVDRMSRLMRPDTDGVLFVLFQRAQYDLSNYSAAHALRCAVLCHLCAAEMRMRSSEAGCLVGAALTMNISMAALQNDLAQQVGPPTPEQEKAIRSHAVRSRMKLAALGISNDLWLDTVASHHEVISPLHGSALESPTIYLPRVLGLVDRYAARLTPRASRAAGAAMKLMESNHNIGALDYDAAAAAIVKAVGVCPPGTYVRLVNNEIAVVLRQGARANQPLVASIEASSGSGKFHARLIDTGHPDYLINGSMLSSDLDIIPPRYQELARLLPAS